MRSRKNVCISLCAQACSRARASSGGGAAGGNQRACTDKSLISATRDDAVKLHTVIGIDKHMNLWFETQRLPVEALHRILAHCLVASQGHASWQRCHLFQQTLQQDRQYCNRLCTQPRVAEASTRTRVRKHVGQDMQSDIRAARPEQPQQQSATQRDAPQPRCWRRCSHV